MMSDTLLRTSISLVIRQAGASRIGFQLFLFPTDTGTFLISGKSSMKNQTCSKNFWDLQGRRETLNRWVPKAEIKEQIRRDKLRRNKRTDDSHRQDFWKWRSLANKKITSLIMVTFFICTLAVLGISMLLRYQVCPLMLSKQVLFYSCGQ